MKNLREVFRQYFALTIRTQGSQIDITGNRATVTTNLTVTGTGTGFVEVISSEVNRLPTPWVFTWQKNSVWPWDWRLVHADNAGLTIPGGYLP